MPWALFAMCLLAMCLALAWALGRSRARARDLERRLHGQRVHDGHVAEALAPLTDSFPVDVNRAGTATHFLGAPVDYVHFDPEDGITFIEVKSGRARLSPRQGRFRELIEAGHVFWESHRVR